MVTVTSTSSVPAVSSSWKDVDKSSRFLLFSVFVELLPSVLLRVVISLLSLCLLLLLAGFSNASNMLRSISNCQEDHKTTILSTLASKATIADRREVETKKEVALALPSHFVH